MKLKDLTPGALQRILAWYARNPKRYQEQIKKAERLLAEKSKKK